MKRSRKIAIVGAGVGGLSVAARLAKDGHKVQLFEKLSRCGGRSNILEDRGFQFDTGPSFVLMPDFFDEFFSYCGLNLTDYLYLKPLDVHYKIFYPDGETLTVYRDTNRTKGELERIENGAALKYEYFISETERIYKLVRPLLYESFKPKSLLRKRIWSLFGSIRPFESYWQLARKYFKNEKLLFAFTFEAMFIGVSPFAAPAFYSIISYVDHVGKIFHPMGGMYKIPLALEKIAKDFGAEINFNTEIRKIYMDNSMISVETDRQKFVADKVVVNADYAYAQDFLLGRKIPKYRYSCSVFLIYLGLKKKINGLGHHNLFFAKNIKKNLDGIFKYKIMTDDFSFYVHVPTVTDDSLAPIGKEIVYVLIPVPNLESGEGNIMLQVEAIRRTVFETLRQRLGISFEDLIEVEHRFYPRDFWVRYNIKNGATFGLAHNLMQSAFFRPPNSDSRINGLYFVGASTQPGGGLPPVIASSRIVADLINL